MFKENDSMRPGPTPERVLAICRLLEDDSYNQTEIYTLTQLNEEAISEEALQHSIEAAKELGLIRVEHSKYILNIPKESLRSAVAFRRAIAPIIFARANSTFFKFIKSLFTSIIF